MSNHIITLSMSQRLESGQLIKTPDLRAQFIGDNHQMSVNNDLAIDIEETQIDECKGMSFVVFEFNEVKLPDGDRTPVKKANMLFKIGVEYFQMKANLTNIKYQEFAEPPTGSYTFRGCTSDIFKLTENEAKIMFPHLFDTGPEGAIGHSSGCCGTSAKAGIAGPRGGAR